MALSIVTEPIVQVVDLVKQVISPEQELTILDGVSLSIEKGDSVAIVGVSGSGKSTLLGLMAGLDLPSSGVARLQGVDLSSIDEDGRAQLRARHVGFVFQNFQLLPGLTALENVMLPMELVGLSEGRDAALNVLDRVGLSHRLRHYPSQLSGGEQQRVAIARAFVINPSLLLADEPTGNLDKKTGKRIADLLFALNAERGTTLVLVTHDEELGSRCTRRLELEGGKLLSQGT